MADAGGPPDAAVLTVEEVSRRLRVSEATVYNLIRGGQLPAFRVGRSWRIDEGDLDEYIRRQKRRLRQVQILVHCFTTVELSDLLLLMSIRVHERIIHLSEGGQHLTVSAPSSMQPATSYASQMQPDRTGGTSWCNRIVLS